MEDAGEELEADDGVDDDDEDDEQGDVEERDHGHHDGVKYNLERRKYENQSREQKG